MAERLAGGGSRFSGRYVRPELWDWFALEIQRLDRLEKRKPGRPRSKRNIVHIGDVLNIWIADWQTLSEDQREEQIQRYLEANRRQEPRRPRPSA